MNDRIKRSLALAGILMTLALVVVLGRTAVAAPGLEDIVDLSGSQVGSAPAAIIVVNSTADSGPGTLRQALLDAGHGDTITFDPVIFPPGNPVTIGLTTSLLQVFTEGLTIDASEAGVILDGIGIGTDPQPMLLDDVSITLDGGSNLIVNGDFSAGLGHWRPWDERPGATRTLNNSDFHLSAPSFEWNVVAHVGESRTVYDTTDTSDPVEDPFDDSGTVWIPVTGGSTIELRFWYKYGGTSVNLHVLNADDDSDWLGEWSFYWQTDWTEAVVSMTLPQDAVSVGVALHRHHGARWESGLNIGSQGNTIRGLMIVNFPGNGISLGYGAADNVIGGDRGVGAGPVGQGNLISRNGLDGIGLSSPGVLSNTIQGNLIGTDVTGQIGAANAGNGIQISGGASHNLVGGSQVLGGGVCSGACNLISDNGGNGILIAGAGTEDNKVQGNYIGTNVDGTAAMGNGAAGVTIQDDSQGNVVGGDLDQDQGNLISGNGGRGVYLRNDADGNTVSGNYIGTDASGTAIISNGTHGIMLVLGSSNNLVGGINSTPGGACSGACNLISGNIEEGVVIDGDGSEYNTISGNYIGTDVSGTAPLGNGSDGVRLDDGPAHNTVGGLTGEERNLISGNNRDGIHLMGAHYNVVTGNYIGLDSSGTMGISNSESGINLTEDERAMATTHNTVEGNVVSGNGMNGIDIFGTDTAYNVIRANYIGTDANGTGALGNAGQGIMIVGGASHNLIGGSNATPGGACSGDCNLIGANGDSWWQSGVWIEGSGTMSNTVSGNYIGTDVQGTTALGNAAGGLDLRDGAEYNVVGGATPGERNLISGNGQDGVTVGGAHHNRVMGNYIGTDASGLVSLGNTERGIGINELGQGLATTYNEVEGNLISGNGMNGIDIYGADTEYNVIRANYIGTDATGSAALGNDNGCWIAAGAHNNTIDGNLISGNDHRGILIRDPGTNSNIVTGNYIGTDANGTVDMGNETGVQISGGAQGNIVGGVASGQGNLIGGNTLAGIAIWGNNADGNVISGNLIGTDVHGTGDLGNGYGVVLGADASDNLVGGPTAQHGNVIAYHGAFGVSVFANDSLRNTISHNSIYDNTGLGIDLTNGGNTELPAPVITAFDLAAGTASGTACANCSVELFSDEHGEGRWFEASTTADASGNWNISKGSAFTGPELTAIATDGAGNTSEFGQDWPADPPPPPVIAAPVCGVTNRSLPTFSGFGQMGSTVQAGAGELILGETTTDDQNRWTLMSGETLADATHLVTATATTAWGTSAEAELDLTVDTTLCYDPVGVTFTQRGVTQHPRDANGCADPAEVLEVNLWPNMPATVSVPVDVPTATVYVEVNSVQYHLSDPDGDGLFAGSFTTPGSGNLVILLVVDCGAGPQTMQIGSTIDPDGYVYDAALTASTGITHTVAGVTVTLYVSDTVRGRWLAWDAALYDQVNPQVTAEDGYFAFFTPPGDYKLLADGQHLGYELYGSPVLTVVDAEIRYNVPLWLPRQHIYLPLVLRNH